MNAATACWCDGQLHEWDPGGECPEAEPVATPPGPPAEEWEQRQEEALQAHLPGTEVQAAKTTDGDGLGPQARAPGARHTDPDTSHQAAASLPGELTPAQQGVLDVMKRRAWPTTDRWIVSAYYAQQAGGHFPELPKQSSSGIRSRRKELVDLGLVRDSKQREVLESGRKAIRWEVVPDESASA